MPSPSKVCFFFQGVQISLRERTLLKRFIESIFKKEGKRLESLNYIFCSDNALLDINRQYLSHDYYTDIITFDLSASDQIQGEIYLSTDRVRDNAKSLCVTVQEELHRVIFHGVLHLCGYGDKKPAEERKMRERENHYLKVWNNRR
ncbi:MAG: rRNA maturation RNase YbeY [Bacteroidetes bacterium]|nr:rRNA maturation RNase YbeY [Bacteroidota bacterium]